MSFIYDEFVKSHDGDDEEKAPEARRANPEE